MNVRQHIKALRILALRLNDRTVEATIGEMDKHIEAIRAQLAPEERQSATRERKRAGFTRAEG